MVENSLILIMRVCYNRAALYIDIYSNCEREYTSSYISDIMISHQVLSFSGFKGCITVK